MPGAFAFDSSFAIADFLDLGVSLMMSNRHEEAIVQFDYVLGFDSCNRYARWNKCLSLLSLGRYDEGWLEHDWAWTLFDWRALGPVKGNVDRLFDIPLWTGGRDNVVFYHEMGFGDAIMLMRFIPQLVAMCKSVTLIVRPELVSLMRGRGAKVLGSIPEDVSMFNSRATLFNSVGIGKLHKEIPNDP